MSNNCQNKANDEDEDDQLYHTNYTYLFVSSCAGIFLMLIM